MAMPGIAELALGAAPIAGGALLGVAAGSFKGPDIRAMIAKDMDLLERIPDGQPELKARLKASIDERINDLIAATEKTREIRQMAASYQGNWRDIVVFICAILFTIIWWNVSHSRSNWLLMFVVLIVLSILAGLYAARGIFRDSRLSGTRAEIARQRISSGRCPTARGCGPVHRRRRIRTVRCRMRGRGRGSCSLGRCAAGPSHCGSRRRRARTRRKTPWPK